MVCAKCGARIDPRAFVCLKCGTPAGMGSVEKKGGEDEARGGTERVEEERGTGRENSRRRGSAFAGRATRKEYWGKCLKVSLPTILICGLLTWAMLESEIKNFGADDGGEVGAVAILACLGNVAVGIWAFFAMLPVTVRRLHDRNMSGRWLLLFWGLQFLPGAGWIAGLVQFIIVGCLAGTRGPNRYGPDPRVGC